VVPFKSVALQSNHHPLPSNLNSKKRKKKKEKNKNQNMDYKSRLRMYVLFVEQEIPNNLI
jgi:ribosomal protein S20